MIINNAMDECSACEACRTVCPVSAIDILENAKGFMYPHINNKCINCKRCYNVCPLNHETKDFEPEIYAFQIKSIEKRLKSQSGGAFTYFAEEVIKRGGVVYGVALVDLMPKYMRVASFENLDILKGSKYVEARVDNVFNDVKNDLKNGRLVLFSGTACHVEGLHNFIKKAENLITCDLICHGVPSRALYTSYLNCLKNEKGNISKFNFRDKVAVGWHDHVESYDAMGYKEISRDYTNLFYLNVGLRESCYKCRYASEKRHSDITIGDFWGIEKFYPEKDDNKGTSVIMLRTNKAKDLFSKALDEIAWKIELAECIQPNLLGPTSRPENTDEFWNDVKLHDFQYLLRNYSDARYKININRTIITAWGEFNKKRTISDFFEKRDIYDIAVSGDLATVKRVVAEVKRIGKINISIVIDTYSISKSINIYGVPVKNLDTITDKDFSNIGAILISDEVNMADILSKFFNFGIGMEYIYPLSFILSEEEA